MNLQDFLTTLKIRKLNRDPFSKTSRTEKCGSRESGRLVAARITTPLEPSKPSILCQKLVQCLLTLIVSAAHSGAVTFLADGIDFINKYDTWCFLIGLFKKITYLQHPYQQTSPQIPNRKSKRTEHWLLPLPLLQAESYRFPEVPQAERLLA